MNRLKTIIAIVIAFALGGLSMVMDWVGAIGYYEKGVDIEATILLIPIGIILGLSLIGLIKNKVLNIVMDALSIVVSFSLVAFMLYYYGETQNIWGVGMKANVGIGLILMMAVSIALVVISILSLRFSSKMDNAISNNIQGNTSAFCIQCGAKLNHGQTVCSCNSATTNETEESIVETSKENTTEIALENEADKFEIVVDLEIEETKLEEVKIEEVKIEEVKIEEVKIEEVKLEDKTEVIKEVISVFCTGCGTKLNDEVKFCVNCGTKVEEEETSITQTVIEPIEKVEPVKQVESVEKVEAVKQVESVEKVEEVKPVKKDKHKSKALIITLTVILSIVAVVGVGGVTLLNKYKSENVPQELIEEDLIDATVIIGYLDVKITEDNLESVTLNKKEITKNSNGKTYDNDGTLVIEDKGYKIDVPFEIEYTYEKGSKDWSLEKQNIKVEDKDVIIEVKEKVTETIIKDTLVGKYVNGVEITSEIANALKITVMADEKDENGSFVTVEATLSEADKIKTRIAKLNSKIVFTGTDWVVLTIDDSKVEGNTSLTNNQNNNNNANNQGNSSEKLKNDYVIPASSSVKLSFSELNEYTADELLVARNELLARKGYSFNGKPNLKKHFSSKSWYRENSSFTGELTEDIEKWNLKQLETAEFSKRAYEKSGDLKDNYILPASNSTVQDSYKISSLTDWELIIARNEIFARYGLNFSTFEIKRHFVSRSWFKVNDALGNDMPLTEVENKNIELILDEEEKRMERELNRDL